MRGKLALLFRIIRWVGESARRRVLGPTYGTLCWAYSSVGKSARLISVRSVVQIHLGPPIHPARETG